ncbi:MAG TPA: hypothetical protein VFB28_14145 [Terriglobales bacterium]|nr:hypothetical protein [Terriglobales bacterium]
MPQKKKKKTKSTTRPAKRTGLRSAKKVKAKPAAKRITRTRVASKPSTKSRKRSASINVEKELKREFQTRNAAGRASSTARKSEDFEGLSQAEQADSESVDELVEEGNVFEAGAVAGVEEADDAGEREVHTREVPEDDVPEEYLDEN